ncbi:flagellar biosynthesis protein FlhB [Helicobacter mustelae]|uniref:Flagellar biosynthetic protein FlhB n=1 Tax=Helicobacter mustelae (strain ATCC 43772 / CCUG 25715 / CIP 103759 / LMG 18044 / NCTC 12198 / R85-136P) TaxID=679897 RepID=D3UH92_HELM1|nr:flagellar biosynthesis protein FlhB [Helicobacter mustelae]CBG39864.1 flagellar biosynthetic protein [Helicobacter mustelae 12198]SQH71374.1 flagellar biosynthetic protein [Helicobacter mustelae]STP12502.1 flagellar biosynthetic protein [Helicobacter mustelae]
MADEQEKQEAPSARKIQKAREEGNVAKSPELVAFVSFVIGIFAVFGIFPFWLQNIKGIYITCLQFFSMEFSLGNFFDLFLKLLWQTLLIILPVLGALLFAGVFGNIIQVGFLLAPKVLQPKLGKLNPIAGLKNLFSFKKLLEGLLITLKVFVAFLLGGAILIHFLRQIPNVAMLNVFSQAIWVRDKALILIASLLVLFFVMAIIDFLIKKFQYTKSLRMSKQELKDEYKQQEGNPEVKAKIRQIMMKNTMGKMMQAIPNADVVVTNPTHYAIALRFAPNDPAPIVVAKGIDHLAIRIKGIARENEIEIVENPKLARALYKQVDLEEPIPRELFEAVAIIFAQLKKFQEKYNNLAENQGAKKTKN